MCEETLEDVQRAVTDMNFSYDETNVGRAVQLQRLVREAEDEDNVTEIQEGSWVCGGGDYVDRQTEALCRTVRAGVFPSKSVDASRGARPDG